MSGGKAPRSSLFLKLLSYDDKSAALTEMIASVGTGYISNLELYIVNPAEFYQIPGSPFAYWVSDYIRKLFVDLPSFGGEERMVKQGLATAEDFRFVRTWWEVPPTKIVTGTLETTPEEFNKSTFVGKRWVPFAKGGAYSPYYSDIHLLVNWERDGEEMKSWAGSLYNSSHWSRIIKNVDFYFRSGITWPRRTNGLSFRIMPGGCIFGDKGPTAFVMGDKPVTLLALVAMMNSSCFNLFVKMLVARVSLAQSFEVGLIQSIPMPSFSDTDLTYLSKLAYACSNEKRILDSSNENSHAFHLAKLLQVTGNTLTERITAWQKRVVEAMHKLAECQNEIDSIASRLYGIQKTDIQAIEVIQQSETSPSEESAIEFLAEVEESVTLSSPIDDACILVVDLLSYITGCIYGRWDVRFITEERPAPELPELFTPLPICSPGMLINDDGLPTTQDRFVSEKRLRTYSEPTTLPSTDTVQQPTIQETQYPITVAWDGILVDDMDHAADIVRRVREVLAVLWPSEDGAKAEAIEREVSEILGIKDLREHFRRQGDFFARHLKRYSKSRRQAPIYWPLSTASGSYTLWIYYHRLTSDTLFTATNQYVEPKITEIQRKIGELEGRLTGTTGREATRLREEVESARALLAELQDFRAELLRVAALPYRPDLNDGAIINAAPLHRLFRLPKWAKDTKACWEKLQRGEYDWAHLAYMIWPDRVREKCRADHSLAIAHGLEHLYLGQPTIAQRKRSRKAVPDKEDEE